MSAPMKPIYLAQQIRVSVGRKQSHLYGCVGLDEELESQPVDSDVSKFRIVAGFEMMAALILLPFSSAELVVELPDIHFGSICEHGQISLQIAHI